MKEAEEKGNNYEENEDSLYQFFTECTRDILAVFFEERPEEVTQSILDRWYDKHEEEQQRQEREMEMKAKLFWMKVKNIVNRKQRIAFEEMKANIEADKENKMKEELDNLMEKKVIAEASLSALQIELREALQTIARLEKKEEKRIEK